MKQIVISKYGDTDVLKIQEGKDPEPLTGEVLIIVKAGYRMAAHLKRGGGSISVIQPTISIQQVL